MMHPSDMISTRNMLFDIPSSYPLPDAGSFSAAPSLPVQQSTCSQPGLAPPEDNRFLRSRERPGESGAFQVCVILVLFSPNHCPNQCSLNKPRCTLNVQDLLVCERVELQDLYPIL